MPDKDQSKSGPEEAVEANLDMDKAFDKGPARREPDQSRADEDAVTLIPPD